MKFPYRGIFLFVASFMIAHAFRRINTRLVTTSRCMSSSPTGIKSMSVQEFGSIIKGFRIFGSYLSFILGSSNQSYSISLYQAMQETYTKLLMWGSRMSSKLLKSMTSRLSIYHWAKRISGLLKFWMETCLTKQNPQQFCVKSGWG